MNTWVDNSSCSVRAYEDTKRVRRYDRDMDLLHPNRHRMIGVTLEILSDVKEQPSRVLDLGIGTAFFAARILQHHPNATLFGVDGSASMIEVAQARLRDAGVADRAELVTARFEDFDSQISRLGPFDIVFSSYALHHLSAQSKGIVLSQIYAALKPGGWFLNADFVLHSDPTVEKRIQRIRVEGILARNAASSEPDSRFLNTAQVRKFLDDLEKNEGDNPLSVKEDLDLIHDCGCSPSAILGLTGRFE